MWRPDNWKMPISGTTDLGKGQQWAFEQGASAMLSALVKWLEEPCTNHPQPFEDYGEQGFFTNYTMPEHRYLCSQCMAELKESD